MFIFIKFWVRYLARVTGDSMRWCAHRREERGGQGPLRQHTLRKVWSQART